MNYRKHLITITTVALVLVLLSGISIHMTLFEGMPRNVDDGGQIPSYTYYDPATVRFEARLFKRGELAVYPGDGARTMEVGDYVYFTVEHNGEKIHYDYLDFEVVEGRDSGAVYYSGGLRGLGEGMVTVKAYLEEDPGVYGYGTIQVEAARQGNIYTEKDFGVSDAPHGDDEFENSLSGFPESYKPYLRAIHVKYPNWEFKPFYTGQSFYDAVYNQGLDNKNLTLTLNYADLLKRKEPGDYDRNTHTYVMKDDGWSSVNNAAVSYFMDPRNFLNEKDIFQFENLSYDESFHTAEGVEGILKGTFMYKADTSYLDKNGNFIESATTYAEVIFEAGKQADISPYFLASKIRQEIGSTPSMAATGTCPGYEGLYNFYNIGATDGEGNIERGLAWAGSGISYGRPWTSPEKSIMGGAGHIAQNYVNAGQFTGYLQKFNVNPNADSDMHTHQYMTSVTGAAGQGSSVFAGYEEVGLLQAGFVFYIPVFDDMPGADNGTAQSISIIGETPGIMRRGTVLRGGPAAFYGPADGIELKPFESVTVKRAVATDAAYYMGQLYFPVWYEVSVLRGEVEHIGFVSEEFINRVAMDVLAVGETIELDCTVMPAGSDDVAYYISENPNVATVSQNGVVTATGTGLVKIIAYTSSGAMDCVSVMVV